MSSGNIDIKLIITDFYGVIFLGNQLNTGYLELLSRLSQSYRIVCYSNSPEDEFSSKPELKMLSKVYSATELNLEKSNSRSYRKIAEAESVKPHQIIFIDDQPQYITASTAAGCFGITYFSTSALKRELAALDIKV